MPAFIIRRHHSASALISATLLIIGLADFSSAGDGLPALPVADETPARARPAKDAAKQPDSLPPHLIVVRISNRMLSGLIDQPIEVQTAVNEEILDTPLKGTAKITGRIHAGLAPANNEARFRVIFEGDVFSKTVGHHGPAVIHGHSVTHFAATKDVVFEPGRGFYALPARVNAQTQCFHDSVESTRGGVLGRVVQRRAKQKLEENQDEITRQARQSTTARIAAAIEEHLDGRLDQLNRAIEVRTTLAQLRDEQPAARLACRTTKTYLEIATAPSEGNAGIELPVYTSANGHSAPIEIWVHQAIVPPRLAAFAEVLLARPQDSLVGSILGMIPGSASRDACTALTAFVRDQHLGMQQVGEWVVFEVNAQPSPALVAEAPTLLR